MATSQALPRRLRCRSLASSFAHNIYCRTGSPLHPPECGSAYRLLTSTDSRSYTTDMSPIKGSINNVLQSFAPKPDMQKEYKMSLIQRDIERIRTGVEKMHNDLRYEIDKVTIAQKLDINLERGRTRDDLSKQSALFTQRRHLSSSPDTSCDKDTTKSETITVTFVDKDGDEKVIKVPLGMSMLEAAHQNDIELEGACEGSLACSTCHVIVMDEEYFKKLPEPADEENDMLDLAFGLTETSRLGCQVIARPELDGIRLAIPSATRNFAVDGYVPKPH